MAATIPIDLTAFDPSLARAEAVSERMRRALADRLRYIIDQAAGHVTVPTAEMAGFLRRLAGGPVSPLVFGTYCDLVLALDGDDLDEARPRRSSRRSRRRPMPPPSCASSISATPAPIARRTGTCVWSIPMPLGRSASFRRPLRTPPSYVRGSLEPSN
jgi:hypothetical protein